MSAGVCTRCRFPNDGEGPLCSVCAGVRAIGRQAGQGSAGALWLDDLHAPAGPPTASPSDGPVVSPVRHDAQRRALAKAERRAQVRRLRLLSAQTDRARTPPDSEVLVLDAAAARRSSLVAVLQDLGFRAVAASSLDGVPQDWPQRPIAAAFIDASQRNDEGGDGIELCRQLLEAGWLDRGGASALVLMAVRLSPVDRVRARLAGCDAVLDQALSRGAVAQVLDSRGVVLPSDRRCR